ncbi:hypothetical protein NIES267_44700 [Calothrix parasitica NIES-267]|uniref:Uncharacterized protein n=1 Tax=Calothrix parasitica NIES-267 TaxID=1973488 RepID=A0A1Z4LUP5_9CYAN|nr:hypothetical protein NIES267_44700 [Calothrix parasitica NIES-267]
MKVHKIETILNEDGTLTLRGLPFHAGDTVEVIILKTSIPKQKSALESQVKEHAYPLEGKVLHYDNPTEPVALED